MPPSPRLLRPERRSNGIDAAHARDQRLSIQLPALRQVRFLIEILHLEQSRPTLHGSRGKAGNMNLGKAVLVEPFANRGENHCPHSENRAHLVTPDKQVPLVQEKLGTMELFCNRKLFKSRMHDSPLIHLDLSPARRSGISFHLSPQLNTRLYSSRLELLESLVADLALSQRTLNNP